MAKSVLTNGRNEGFQVLQSFITTHLNRQKMNESRHVQAAQDAAGGSGTFRHLAKKAGEQTLKQTTKFQDATDRKKATMLKTEQQSLQKMVDRIQFHGEKQSTPTPDAALREAFAQTNHPDLLSTSAHVDTLGHSHLNWPVEMSLQVHRAGLSKEQVGSDTSRRFHHLFLPRLRELFPTKHIEIRSIEWFKTCEVNGLKCEISPSRGPYTSVVEALRVNVATGLGSLAPALVRCLCKVTLTASTPLIATLGPVSNMTSPCTCIGDPSPSPCFQSLSLADPTGANASPIITLSLVLVDWLKTYSEAYPAFSEPIHPAKLKVTSLVPEHEFNFAEASHAHGQVISARRLIHGIVLKKETCPTKPDYHVWVRLPKCL
jgi:hypothetical protein